MGGPCRVCKDPVDQGKILVTFLATIEYLNNPTNLEGPCGIGKDPIVA